MSQAPNFRDIEAFNAVAVELSFRRAAERLSLDQSALSRRIRNLEQMLGYQLIRRTTREVSLTSAGEVFHERTRLIGGEIERAAHAARIAAEGKRGQLRIGYMSFAAIEWMPKIVAAFTKEYPDIDLELRYIRTQGQKIELARNSIDLGFMLGPFQHPQFESVKIDEDALVALLPVDHRLSTRPGVLLEDIARYPMVLGSMAEWEFFRMLVMDVFAQAGHQVNIKFEASNAMGILGLVGSGLGVSVYAQAIERFQPRTVMIRPIVDCRTRVETLLAWNRAYRNPALTNFVAIARRMVAKNGK